MMGGRFQFALSADAVVGVQIHQIIFGQVPEPLPAEDGGELTDGEQGTIGRVGPLDGALLDHSQEIVPQYRSG